MQRIERHSVDEDRIVRALDDFHERVRDHYIGLRDGSGLKAMRTMALDLHGHVAARSVADPALGSDRSFTQEVLTTAAEAYFGVLSLGICPEGDFDVPFPLVAGRLTNLADNSEDNVDYECGIDLAPGPDAWVEAFTMLVVSGHIWESSRVFGPMLRGDHAPEIRDGVPGSWLEPDLDPADLAQMDALCVYLNDTFPRHPCPVLCKPGAEERGQAARGLDAVGELGPEQRLLRVLLEDDQSAFERALAEHLESHRELMEADADAVPGTLLPVGVIALAALAVQVHGWKLAITSDYLPSALLHAPEGAPEVAAL